MPGYFFTILRIRTVRRIFFTSFQTGKEVKQEKVFTSFQTGKEVKQEKVHVFLGESCAWLRYLFLFQPDKKKKCTFFCRRMTGNTGKTVNTVFCRIPGLHSILSIHSILSRSPGRRRFPPDGGEDAVWSTDLYGWVQRGMGPSPGVRAQARCHHRQ